MATRKPSKSAPRLTPRAICDEFARAVRKKFAAVAPGHEEDQLRRPVDQLLEAMGTFHNLNIVAKDESPLADQLGRPDFAVTSDKLLCGYLELKSPGTGADPSRFKGHNLRQWKRFQHLPNLVYTDGMKWALVRNGEILRVAQFPDDITQMGEAAIDEASSVKVTELLLDFFQWEPIVPKSAKQLAQLVAPLCRMLRDDVLDAIDKQSSAIIGLTQDWRRYLFPKASNESLADSYAQTVLFALLLARSDGSDTLILDEAIQKLTHANGLLARALQVLIDPQLTDDIGASLSLIQRVVQAVPTGTMTKGRRDPWLHFYEDFLAEYDPELRKNAGAYYTPVEVVQAQVRLVDQLLREKFGKPLGFAEGDVATLDPAVGTGTYLLGIIEHAMERVRQEEGEGALRGRAENLAKQLHGLELMVGPYAVAALRLTRAFHDFNARIPRQGVSILLSNTLESPHAAVPELPLLYRPLGEHHKAAQYLKEQVPVLVCIGNPPYDRHAAARDENRMMTGGWVRWGDLPNGSDAILASFIDPVRKAKKGGQLKNLYNLYVYFWRWAMWKVFERRHAMWLEPGSGIVSFITASSFIDGDAFLGMREYMRRQCDEIWVIDLGGEGRGVGQEENIFAIKTPVAISIAVQYHPRPENPKKQPPPAKVNYCRIEGTRAQKLAKLESIEKFADLKFQTCSREWQAPFRPQPKSVFFSWPQLIDLMPWQTSGAQFKRTWPISGDQEVLEQRWKGLLSAADQSAAFKETRDRKITSQVESLDSSIKLSTIASLSREAGIPDRKRYGYRSFDRQWVIADPRLADFMRPSLWLTHSARQLYFGSLLTKPLGNGPALTVTSEVPDLDYFSGRGAKDILPLYRDVNCEHPNFHPALQGALKSHLGHASSAEDIAAYLVAITAHPGFTARFSRDLSLRQLRIPITLDRRLFSMGVDIGKRLIYLHTLGERALDGQTWPKGKVRCVKSVPTNYGLPATFRYDAVAKQLFVGEGVFEPVSPEVFGFEVSTLKVLKSWLGYRMKSRKGKKSSPLDSITPVSWTADMTSELLRLVQALEEIIGLFPEQLRFLERVLDKPILTADILGPVPPQHRVAELTPDGQSALDI